MISRLCLAVLVGWFSLVAVAPAGLAQLRAPVDDATAEELTPELEAVLEARRTAAAMLREGTPADEARAFEMLEWAYDEALAMGSGFVRPIALRLAMSHDVRHNWPEAIRWYGVYTTHIEGSTHPHGGRLGSLLELEGEYERAARALVRSDRADLDGYDRYQKWMQAGKNYVRAGMFEAGIAALNRAGEHLETSDRGTDREMLSLRLYTIYDAERLPGDSGERLEALLELHRDEDFADEPFRLTLASRLAVIEAERLGLFELAESLGREVLFEVERLEELYGEELHPRAELDMTYIQTAGKLASALRGLGRGLEGVQVLESAREAYPDSEYAWMVTESLEYWYERYGIEQEVPGAPRAGAADVMPNRTAPAGAPAPDGESLAIEPSAETPASPEESPTPAEETADAPAPDASEQGGFTAAGLVIGAALALIAGVLILRRRAA